MSAGFRHDISNIVSPQERESVGGAGGWEGVEREREEEKGEGERQKVCGL